jgi:hypothetical protein
MDVSRRVYIYIDDRSRIFGKRRGRRRRRRRRRLYIDLDLGVYLATALV